MCAVHKEDSFDTFYASYYRKLPCCVMFCDVGNFLLKYYL